MALSVIFYWHKQIVLRVFSYQITLSYQFMSRIFDGKMNINV